MFYSALDILESISYGTLLGTCVGVALIYWLRTVDRWLAEGVSMPSVDACSAAYFGEPLTRVAAANSSGMRQSPHWAVQDPFQDDAEQLPGRRAVGSPFRSLEAADELSRYSLSRRERGDSMQNDQLARFGLITESSLPAADQVFKI